MRAISISANEPPRSRAPMPRTWKPLSASEQAASIARSALGNTKTLSPDSALYLTCHDIDRQSDDNGGILQLSESTHAVRCVTATISVSPSAGRFPPNRPVRGSPARSMTPACRLPRVRLRAQFQRGQSLAARSRAPRCLGLACCRRGARPANRRSGAPWLSAEGSACRAPCRTPSGWSSKARSRRL